LPEALEAKHLRPGDVGGNFPVQPLNYETGSAIFRRNMRSYVLTDIYFNDEAKDAVLLIREEELQSEGTKLLEKKNLPNYGNLVNNEFYPKDLIKVEYCRCTVGKCKAKVLFHYFKNKNICRFDKGSHCHFSVARKGLKKHHKKVLIDAIKAGDKMTKVVINEPVA
jgi:hypothetical protein